MSALPLRDVVAAPTPVFRVLGAAVEEHAAAPTLRFTLGIDAADARIESMALQVQIRIAALARVYDEGTRERLRAVFGDPSEQGRTIRGLFWTQASLMVPDFLGTTETDLLVPLSYDFDVAAAKYLDAVRDGEIPLELLFRGSMFYEAEDGLRVVRVGWDREARFAMRAGLWREAMDLYFPGCAWVRVRRDVFDRLRDHRASRCLPSWDATIEDLL